MFLLPIEEVKALVQNRVAAMPCMWEQDKDQGTPGHGA